MIQATELRIGNLITSESSMGVAWEVMPSDIEKIYLNEQHYSGVPITEEWLLKFSWGKWKDGDMTDGHCKMYFDTRNKEFGLFDEVDGSKWRLRKIKFVHELQNFYYAYTGRELTIKQPATV